MYIKTKILLMFFLLAMFISIPADMRKKVAVSDFLESDAVMIKGAKDTAISKLEKILFDLGTVIVLDRENINRALNELALGQTGIVDENSAGRLGKMLGVEYIIYGKILSLTASGSQGFYKAYYDDDNNFKYGLVWDNLTISGKISIKIVEVETSKLIYTQTKTASNSYTINKQRFTDEKDYRREIEIRQKINFLQTLGVNFDNFQNLDEKYRTMALSTIDKLVWNFKKDFLITVFPMKVSVLFFDENQNMITLDIGDYKVHKGDKFMIYKAITKVHPKTGREIVIGKNDIGIVQVKEINENDGICICRPAIGQKMRIFPRRPNKKHPGISQGDKAIRLWRRIGEAVDEAMGR